MSNIDRAINIYQGYSLAKISALNKKSLALQYAQCEQISKLEKSLSKELQAANRLNRQILDNQLKELKRQETIRFYRLIAHNAKEATEIIESQTDKMFQLFLIKVYAKPITLILQDAKSNLEEISDMDFCSIWSKRLDKIVNELSSLESQFAISDYQVVISQQEFYFGELKILLEREKANTIALAQVKPFQEEKKKSIAEYKKRGCLISAIIFVVFCLLVFFVNLGNGAYSGGIASLAIIWVLIPVVILVAVILNSHKKSKGYAAYSDEVDRLNYERLQKYNDCIKDLTKGKSDIAHATIYLDTTHPYKVAKKSIEEYNPNFEEVIESIEALLPKEEKSDTHTAQKHDALIKDVIKMTVGLPSISIAMLQRRFSIGYQRATNIMSQLEDLGVVGKVNGSKGYVVLIDKSKIDLIDKYIKQ